MNDLEKLRPCSGYCQMIGAAVALLSIKDSLVIFNSPRWCALTGERELSCINKDYERRLFCTEARENDILYGIENSLRETIKEALEVENHPKFVSVISSCSMSLIGDDIKGVCENEVSTSKVIALDAGGFTGTFESGYQLGMLALLKNTKYLKHTCIPKKVNLLGICTAYPYWEGNLSELKRILSSAGIEVGVALGADELSIENLSKITEAELNIVLVPEISVKIAEYLFDSYGQRYVVAPMPYGFKGTMKWLNTIAKEIGVQLSLDKLEDEILRLQRDISAESYNIRNLFTDFHLQHVISRLPNSLTTEIFEAINESNIDVLKCNRCYCNEDVSNADDSSVNTLEYVRWSTSSDIKPLSRQSYQLVLSTEKERIMFQNFRKTLYLNLTMPTDKVKPKGVCFVGINGWNNFVHDIFSQIRNLEYINNSL